jgi:hypothetical protein
VKSSKETIIPIPTVNKKNKKTISTNLHTKGPNKMNRAKMSAPPDDDDLPPPDDGRPSFGLNLFFHLCVF